MSVDIDKEALKREVEATLGKNRPARAIPPSSFELNSQSSITHIIGVVSGKGGVGKSFVCASLAIELARKGYRVGVLDADITGPSIPKIFGLAGQHAYGQQDKIIPLTSLLGIKIMSTNLVVEHETDPVLWRGPMLMGAIKQFFEDTLWGELDYLLVDMPPGTGDVAMTVFQSLPIEGIFMVSTPQDLVQMIVEKALGMAHMMNIAVLGLIENMSYITCPDCARRIYPFGESRLQRTADRVGVDALDKLAIAPELASSCDRGDLEATLPEDILSSALNVLEGLHEHAFTEAERAHKA